MDLSALSDQELISDVVVLEGSHRALTAKLVAYLAEIEWRRLHLVAGYSSMFDFCQKKLGMTPAEAFRRILAARLARRFPVVHELLASGRVKLSTLELLRECITDENHADLLEAASDRSKREVQELLAARFPRAERPSSIRRQATVEPLSETVFRVEFSAGSERCEKLERCRDLMSHANPSRDIGVVVERALDLLLADLERTRLGRVKRPRRPPRALDNGTARPARIVTAVRREVFERDGFQCTYVSDDGRRWDARALLELDHAHPRALGGSDDVTNLRVRCRAHNQLWAEQAFGREHVDHFRQKKSESNKRDSRHCHRQQPADGDTITMTLLEKVHLALRSMGFRSQEARRAVAEVERAHGGNPPLEMEQALREAILFATAA